MSLAEFVAGAHLTELWTAPDVPLAWLELPADWAYMSPVELRALDWAIVRSRLALARTCRSALRVHRPRLRPVLAVLLRVLWETEVWVPRADGPRQPPSPDAWLDVLEVLFDARNRNRWNWDWNLALATNVSPWARRFAHALHHAAPAGTTFLAMSWGNAALAHERPPAYTAQGILRSGDVALFEHARKRQWFGWHPHGAQRFTLTWLHLLVDAALPLVTAPTFIAALRMLYNNMAHLVHLEHLFQDALAANRDRRVAAFVLEHFAAWRAERA
jgi:hypothetical protein